MESLGKAVEKRGKGTCAASTSAAASPAASAPARFLSSPKPSPAATCGSAIVQQSRYAVAAV